MEQKEKLRRMFKALDEIWALTLDLTDDDDNRHKISQEIDEVIHMAGLLALDGTE